MGKENTVKYEFERRMQMKILVTGASGFMGKNLVAELLNRGYKEIFPCDINTTDEELKAYCKECEFVFNLAGINRPQKPEEFMIGNYGFAEKMLRFLKKAKNVCPIMNASSVQAAQDNPYGKSKKAGEDLLFAYGAETGSKIFMYRFPNVFGKWARPDYNSAVATFCKHIAEGEPITVNDRTTSMRLIYIDDLLEELIGALEGHPHTDTNGFCFVPTVHVVTLGEIVNLLYSFKESRSNLMLPNLESGSFEKKLYSTYLSYLPKDQFAYPLKMNVDERGSFTEILKTASNGQFSINISKPGIIKGNHWHHTKNEKFIVVNGNALFQFRKYGEEEIIEYHVSSKQLEIVDIPPGYTHNIINEGDADLVTFVWSNECFNPSIPDTIYEEVKKNG